MLKRKGYNNIFHITLTAPTTNSNVNQTTTPGMLTERKKTKDGAQKKSITYYFVS